MLCGLCAVLLASLASDGSSGRAHSLLRPYDRLMEPLRHRLTLRTSLYQEPDGLLDVAMLQCQQATDANDSQVSITLLRNVAKHLTNAAAANPVLAAVSSPRNPWQDELLGASDSKLADLVRATFMGHCCCHRCCPCCCCCPLFVFVPHPTSHHSKGDCVACPS
jgi:hypothetical protein